MHRIFLDLFLKRKIGLRLLACLRLKYYGLSKWMCISAGLAIIIVVIFLVISIPFLLGWW